MKLIIQNLVFLSFFSIQTSFAQKQDSLLNFQWIKLKEALIRKSNHVQDLSTYLDKSSKIDKALIEKTQILTLQFIKSVNALTTIDRLSVATIFSQHQKLTRLIRKLLIKVRKDPTLSLGDERMLELHSQFEGCENILQYARNQYNDICNQYMMTDLFFGPYERE